MPAKLPVEITDHIIDHLSDDIASLRSCSLVSHAWAPRTRTHLFHNIKLRPGHPILGVLAADAGVRPLLSKARSFELVLDPTVPGRHEMLSLSHNNKSSLGPALLLPSGGIDEETIAMLVESMLKVSSLSLECRIPLQYSTWAVTRFRSPLLRLQAVTHFSAHDVYFTNLGQFQYVICQWPQLRTLTLHKVAFRTFDSDDVDTGKLQLRSLELSNMQQKRTLDYVLALFAKALSSRSIQTLRIWEEALFGEKTEHAIDDLLRTLGSSLRRFDFPWKYDLFKKPRTDFWTPQLQHSTGLQYLCINCSRMRVLFEDLANMLSRMMLPELRAIHLVFDEYCSEQSARVLDLPYIEEEIRRWRAVEDNLQQHSPNLQEFVIWRTVYEASWRSFAVERYSAAWVQVLPRLHAGGMLHINVRPTNPIPGPFDNVPARMQS